MKPTKIYDPGFQKDWVLPELKDRFEMAEFQPIDKIAVETAYGTILCTEEEFDKYSKENDNYEE